MQEIEKLFVQASTKSKVNHLNLPTNFLRFHDQNKPQTEEILLENYGCVPLKQTN